MTLKFSLSLNLLLLSILLRQCDSLLNRNKSSYYANRSCRLIGGRSSQRQLSSSSSSSSSVFLSTKSHRQYFPLRVSAAEATATSGDTNDNISTYDATNISQLQQQQQLLISASKSVSVGEETKSSSSDTKNGSSSSSNTSSNNNKGKPKSLYEILGANPTDTREELKRHYVALARLSHPDALIGQRKSNLSSTALTTSSVSGAATTTSSPVGDFTEIAAAWRILGDAKQRKRYDRNLQAQQLSDDIANWASTLFAKTAAPAAETSLKIFETIALPFLRRTTATTIATVQATVAEGFSVESAVRAVQKASNAIDQIELEEKSTVLEQRAVAEFRKAVDLQQELKHIAQTRLRLALRTSYSGITSAEALLVLHEIEQRYNMAIEAATLQEQEDLQTQQPTKSLSKLWKSASNAVKASTFPAARPTAAYVENEIRTLKQLEESFIETQQTDSATQELYRDQVRQRLQAKTALAKAMQEEEDARIIYEQAKVRVIEQKRLLDTVTSELSHTEHQVQKTSYEVERKSLTVEQQSEKVRLALIRHQMKQRIKQRQQQQKLQQLPQKKRNQRGIVSYNNVTQSELQQPTNATQLTADGELSLSAPGDTTTVLTPMYMSILSDNGDDDFEYGHIISKKENENRLTELANLRQREKILAEQSARLEVKATRLLSRANKIKQQAVTTTTFTPTTTTTLGGQNLVS